MVQKFGVMIKVILQKSGDEKIAVVVTGLPSQHDGHLCIDTGLHQVVRQQLTILEKLILFTLQELRM